MKLVVCSVALALMASAALAQGSSTSDTRSPQNPAVSTSSDNNAAKPVPGANSFSESEARSHIEAKGYTNVSGLSKGQDGIWRGKGMKGGTSHDVSLDYQGSVFGQ